MALRPCDAGGEDGVAPNLHGFPILGMHHRQRAQQPAARQSRQQLRIRNLRQGVGGCKRDCEQVSGNVLRERLRCVLTMSAPL